MKHGAGRRWNHFAPQVQDDLSNKRDPSEENDLDERSLATPVGMKSIQG